jgi:hypothetical protein
LSPITEYIDGLPVPPETKWLVSLLARADRNVFTQGWIVDNTGFPKKRIEREHLYKLIDCGVLSRHREGNEYRYSICDTRLLHNMAAENGDFESLTNN